MRVLYGFLCVFLLVCCHFGSSNEHLNRFYRCQRKRNALHSLRSRRTGVPSSTSTGTVASSGTASDQGDGGHAPVTAVLAAVFEEAGVVENLKASLLKVCWVAQAPR